jgi:hypothetical protein
VELQAAARALSQGTGVQAFGTVRRAFLQFGSSLALDWRGNPWRCEAIESERDVMTYKALTVAVAACGLMLLTTSGPTLAGDGPSARTSSAKGKSAKMRKSGTRVRAYMARGGYYSYMDSDVMNTYAGSRTLYGSTNSYRDPFIDRQTTAGPFDHDFFFDSGIGPRGGDAPYPR